MLYEEKDFVEGCTLCAKILDAKMYLMKAEDDITKQSYAKVLQKSILEYREIVPKRLRDQIEIKEDSLEKYAQKNL